MPDRHDAPHTDRTADTDGPGDWRTARWLALPDAAPPHPGADRAPLAAEFRRRFTAAPGDRLTVRATADSRYRLLLNDQPVTFGPAKGDDRNHYYDTVDLTPLLRPGDNTLTARVVHYPAVLDLRPGTAGPASVHRAPVGGFLLSGTLAGDHRADLLDTGFTGPDGTWECRTDPGWTLDDEHRTPFTTLTGGGEDVDAAADPGPWTPARVLAPAVDPVFGENTTPWRLAPRPVPLLPETPRAFLPPHDGTGPLLRLAPGERAVLDLDAGELTCGYLELDTDGGRGGRIRLTCAERYEPAAGPDPAWPRDRADGGTLRGDPDTYRPAGGPARYEPFEMRVFRYVRLDAEAGPDAPLTVTRAGYRETGYPLDVRADFACSDPELTAMWPISVRTLRRCMHDTYQDCPYWEQLQYVMDTRMQALFTYQVSGDDRLARRALHDFHSTLRPSGLLESRAPSALGQVIPGFALMWVLMLADHHRRFADDALVRRYRPTADAVLEYFERLRDDRGLVGPMEPGTWSFVDWSTAWSATHGAPPQARRAPLAVTNLQYAAALRAAAAVTRATGRGDTAAEYEERAASVSAAVLAHCRGADGLLTDVPGEPDRSVHAQLWAVLSGAVAGEDARALLRAVLPQILDGDGDGADGGGADGGGLAQPSYMMLFYVFRALDTAGVPTGEAFGLWDRWRRFLRLGLTTWPEDEHIGRSDCHAWSAAPLLEFPTRILGVRDEPVRTGRITIDPDPGPLDWARGTVVTPHGPVSVAWERTEDGGLSIRADGPDGVPIDIVTRPRARAR